MHAATLSPRDRPARVRRIILVVLSAVVVVLALTSCGGGDSSSRRAPDTASKTMPYGSARLEETVLHGQGVAIATPARKTDRAVLFLHGSGQDSRSIFFDPQRKIVVATFLAAGYAVAASDANLENWGSQEGVDAHIDLAADLRRRGFGNIAVLAESMGGLSLPGVVSGVRATAAAAWYPVCNMASVITAGRFNDKIARAYGGSLEPPAGLSPVSFAAQPSLHLAIWASPADTVVPKAENADVCASQARAAGIQVVEVPTTGDHGDPSNFQPDNLVTFFNQYVK